MNPEGWKAMESIGWLNSPQLRDEHAVFAALKAGRGTRTGLLNTPIGVAIDLASYAILVLEAGNRRVQEGGTKTRVRSPSPYTS